MLIENSGHGGSLNHLGVEVGSTEEAAAATARLTHSGRDTLVEDATTCCHAVQDKVWVTGPGAERWEVYTILNDAPAESSFACCTGDNDSCCTPDGRCAG